MYLFVSFSLLLTARFVKDSDVTVCALEVLLHYATSGDDKALIDAQVGGMMINTCNECA